MKRLHVVYWLFRKVVGSVGNKNAIKVYRTFVLIFHVFAYVFTHTYTVAKKTPENTYIKYDFESEKTAHLIQWKYYDFAAEYS